MLLHIENLVFSQGDWFITNPLIDQVLQVSTLSSTLIDLYSYCGDTRHKSKNEILLWLENYFNADEANKLVDLFINFKILIEDTHSFSLNQKTINDADFLQYMNFRKSVVHADYSDTTIYQKDQDETLHFLTQDPAPANVANYSNHTIKLFHPASGKAHTAQQKISDVIFFAFGALRHASFLDVLSVLLKSVPSKGCRHPFDLYLCDSQGMFFAPGFYYYRPDLHALELMTTKNFKTKKSLIMYIVINYERYQWRYRHSWAYKDIYLDLGHIVQMLKTKFLELNFSLTEIKNIDFPFEDSLVNECLACYTISID